MPVYLLGEELLFPPPELAGPDGLLAIEGDFRPERLLLAYGQGIFPWPTRRYPRLWFSPDPRFLLLPEKAHLSRSLKKRMRRGPPGGFEVRSDTCFDAVIEACADISRPDQDGTWLTDELISGLMKLHELGFAHSIEAFSTAPGSEGELVGGLYGISLGGAFFGESMFAYQTDASKVAFATLLGNLAAWDFDFVDCQVRTEHLERFGGEDWPRGRFLKALRETIERPTRRGPWTLPLGPKEALKALEEAKLSENTE